MPKQIEWSPSRIDAANYCIMRYHLRYVEKAKGMQLSAYLKGSLLHTELIQKFWENIGVKYSDEKEFAAYAQRMWNYYCIRSEKSERPVVWRFPQERWSIKNDLEGICAALFPILVEEGPPLFSELGFKVRIAGKTFTGRIDELRRRDENIVIRDYKSGRPSMGEMKLNFDPQLTVYNAALNAVISQNDKIARKLGFDGRVINSTGSFINPDFIQEFFMVEAPSFVKRREQEGKKVAMPYLNQAKRTDEHFREVIDMINGTERAVSLGNVYPERGRKCDDCDMKLACAEKLKNPTYVFSQKGQLSLDFAIPLFAKSEEQKQAFLSQDKTQKRLQLRTKKIKPELSTPPNQP